MNSNLNTMRTTTEAMLTMDNSEDHSNNLTSFADIELKEFYKNLPEQLIKCLELTGYDNQQAMSILKDISEIETFLQENGELWKRVAPQDAKCAYGKYYINCPQKFQFRPGHKLLLQTLLNKIQDNEIPNAQREKRQTSLPRNSSSQPAHSCVTTPNVFATPGKSVSQTADTSLNRRRMRKSLYCWCKKQNGLLKKLREDIHYTITFTPTKSEIRCLLCRQICPIEQGKKSLLTSKYRQHMQKFCSFRLCHPVELKRFSARWWQCAQKCASLQKANDRIG